MIFRLPTIRAAVEFRREQYGWTKKQMAKALSIGLPHYVEFTKGKRRLPVKSRCKAFEIGVPAVVLLQTPKTKREYELRQSGDVERDG